MRDFRSLGEYHDALKIQIVLSVLIGGHTIISNQILGVSFWLYTLFCVYLWFNYDPTVNNQGKRSIE